MEICDIMSASGHFSDIRPHYREVRSILGSGHH